MLFTGIIIIIVGYLACITIIMHSNLAAHNVLMDDDGSLKVSDIGFALIDEDILSFPPSKASIRWRAPEVLDSKVWRYSSSYNVKIPFQLPEIFV